MHAVHHIGLETTDLFAMERFYRTVLGFSLDYRYQSVNTPGLKTIFLRRNDIRLELLHRPQNHIENRAMSQAGWGHLSLWCTDVDEAWKSARAAMAISGYPENGWKPPRQTGDGHREATIFDPDGNTIELGQTLRPHPRPAIRAVIFDFDGTLADSEPNYYQAAVRLLSDFGIEYSEADNARYVGKGNHNMLTDLIQRHRLPIGLDELARRKDRYYLEIARRNTRPFPEMARFLDLVTQTGWPVAVASGSSRVVLEELLRQMGIRERFTAVLSSEEVAHGKPAPDVFVEAASRLGVPPQECLVVEDSSPGTEAALRAFMPCMSIPSMPALPLDPTFRLADYLVAPGMSAFDPEAAFRWLKAFPAAPEERRP